MEEEIMILLMLVRGYPMTSVGHDSQVMWKTLVAFFAGILRSWKMYFAEIKLEAKYWIEE